MLLDTITENDVQIALCASDWEDAVKKGATPLLKTSAIEQSYIDGIIQSVHENGPYFVIAKHIALAHTRPECGANKLALNFATLNPPISFGAGENDPVKLLITLSATDANSHLDLLAELVDILMDEEHLDKLFNASSAQQFCSLLK